MLGKIPSAKILPGLILGLCLANLSYGQSWTVQVHRGGAALNAISTYGELVAYAVGDSGKVFKTVDGGLHWDAAGATGVKADLYAVAAVDAKTVYVGGAGVGGIALITSDGGATWRSSMVGPNTYSSIDAIAAIDGRTAFLAGLDNGIFKTADGGLSWVKLDIGLSANFRYVTAADAKTIYAGTSTGILIKTEDGGKTWDSLPQATDERDIGELAGLDAVSADTLFVLQRVQAEGLQVNAAYRSTDGGMTWSQRYRAYGIPWFYSISAINGNIAFASGYSGALARTSDGGKTWTDQKVVTGTTLYSISASNENSAFAIGLDGVILHYGPTLGIRKQPRFGKVPIRVEGGRIHIPTTGRGGLKVRILRTDGRPASLFRGKDNPGLR
jgi:photosystem II stability/assembly factor-like uncharacterized protein